VRARGLRWIIAYKVIKAIGVLALAALLLSRPKETLRWAEELTSDLVSSRWLLHRLGLWLAAHSGATLLRDARWLAILDGGTTAIEAGLLISGRSWGEWVVAFSVASLLPFEAVSLWQHFHWGKVVVLLINGVVAAYLFRRRIVSRNLGR
jgi:hypothetical protein